MLRSLRSFSRSCALVASLALGAGCATTDEASKPITYSLTAKQNYEKGMAELKDENYPEAQKYFQFVKQKYPFSKYAVLSELAVADAYFARGSYNDAIDAYKAFARLHPTHEKVEDGYVAFKVGESYFKDMPDDIWLLPPSFEKDQSAVMDALRELTDFARKFADSPYLKQAADLRRQVLGRLVDHEVYVARFYLKTDHPKAAALRIEGAIRRYPGSGREPELLYTLGETLLRMNELERARETFQRIIDEHGQSADARRAALYLDFIKQRAKDHPQARPADNTPEESAPEAPPPNG
jgi:outer membrane protein assembly factor BamD